MQITSFSYRAKAAIRASLFHLLLSIAVALIAAILVFFIWYPFPYSELAGGRELFFLVVAVDVVCGPLLTLVLFNPKKPKAELIRDLAFVALLQMTALLYGLYTVAIARPVHMVFEVDRLRVVTVADIEPKDIAKASPPWSNLPWFGPTLASIREAKNGDERVDSVDLALQGNEPSMRPNWWQDYQISKLQIIKNSSPIKELRVKHPTKLKLIDSAILESGLTEDNLKWLPLVSYKSMDWVALIDAKTAVPVAYLPLDGF